MSQIGVAELVRLRELAALRTGPTGGSLMTLTADEFTLPWWQLTNGEVESLVKANRPRNVMVDGRLRTVWTEYPVAKPRRCAHAERVDDTRMADPQRRLLCTGCGDVKLEPYLTDMVNKLTEMGVGFQRSERDWLGDRL